MRLGIVGTRTFGDFALLCRVVDEHYPTVSAIVSGGARGADALAARYARERGIPLTEHEASWDQFGPAAGPIRNREIIDDCDELVAFWDGASRGTADAMRKAKRDGKPVRLVRYDEPEMLLR